LEARAGLDEDGGIDAGREEVRLEVGRPECPADRGEVVGQPRVVGGRRVPEVVMGVDDHGSRPQSGVGASGRMRPSARSSPQRSAGIARSASAGYSSRWAGVRTPVTSAVIAGWAIANWTAAARSGTPWRGPDPALRGARATRPSRR